MLSSTSKNCLAMDSYGPVCGSTKEIDRGIRILSKKKKNLEQRRNQLKICAVAALIQQFELPVDRICAAVEEKRYPRINLKQLHNIFFDENSPLITPAIPKYRNPKTGEYWAGRGRTPGWVREAEKRGISRETFRTPESIAHEEAKKPRRTVPPRYLNPSTGETWTGRGRTPIWVQEAQSKGIPKERFLINNKKNTTSSDSSE